MHILDVFFSLSLFRTFPVCIPVTKTSFCFFWILFQTLYSSLQPFLWFVLQLYLQVYTGCAVGLSVTEETIFVKFLQFIRKVYISVISWCTFFPSRSHTFFVTTISLSVSCKSISRILKIFDFSRLILLVQKV